VSWVAQQSWAQPTFSMRSVEDKGQEITFLFLSATWCLDIL